jgi:threonylcarbamoyladenosine tRNA methylthiotransferase MtaB
LATNASLTTDDGRRTTEVHVSDIFAHTELLAAPVFDAANERTRPNLKVQDGCDNRCSFCVIPYVRGQSRSLPLERVLDEVNTLVAAGYREVVISGINLGRWGREAVVSHPSSVVSKTQPSGVGRPWSEDHVPSPFLTTDDGRLTTDFRRLTTLIQAILEQTLLEKLRISSVEPMDWSDELIALVAGSPRIAKHAHVPMQSGSDRVLRRMHRKYRPWHYREKIEKIHAAMPTAAIGADVMVGFPGETEADFEATRRMIDDLPFTYLHVFTYSPRPGTPAAEMAAQVPVPVAHERNRMLRELAAEKKLAFMRSFVGKTIEVITLHSPYSARAEQRDSQSDSRGGVEGPCVSPATFTESLTDNYLKLRLPGQHEPNRWMTVQVERVEGGALVGTAENNSP